MDKLFKAVTKVSFPKSEFSDWYNADSESTARALWDEDCHRYGLPMDKTTVVFVECNPATLEPIIVCAS